MMNSQPPNMTPHNPASQPVNPMKMQQGINTLPRQQQQSFGGRMMPPPHHQQQPMANGFQHQQNGMSQPNQQIGGVSLFQVSCFTSSGIVFANLY